MKNKNLNPLISVIVPIYNSEKYLSRCIDSILVQSYDNLEIILVDDGSTDKSNEICLNYASKDKRIKVFYKENGGQAMAKNLALDYAHGEYIGFVDSDDYIIPTMYEELYNSLKEYDADIAICGVINDHGFTKKKFQYFNSPKQFNTEELLIAYATKPYINSIIPDKLYKSCLWENIRFPDARAREDTYIIHQLYGKCRKAIHIATCGYIQYIRPKSTENSGYHKDKLLAIDAAKNKKKYINDFYPKLNPYYELIVCEIYKTILSEIIVYYSLRRYKILFNKLFEEFSDELLDNAMCSDINKEKYNELKKVLSYPRMFIFKMKLHMCKTKLLNFIKVIFVKT